MEKQKTKLLKLVFAVVGEKIYNSVGGETAVFPEKSQVSPINGRRKPIKTSSLWRVSGNTLSPLT